MTTSPVSWTKLTATVFGAAAIAAAGMGLLAPAAYAQPKSEAQTECSDPEAGGDYSSGTDAGGNTVEKCCYEGLSGVTHCDVWVNGKWNKDQSFLEQPPTAPPVTPGAPPLGGSPQMSPDVLNPPKKNTVPGRSPVVVTTAAQR
ncbi:MAG: hypothetical protein HYZ39_06755 [Mycolicibacterium cosmeticum]|nr:hypothetical protein [Mycolicibacterium cosmeticum]